MIKQFNLNNKIWEIPFLPPLSSVADSDKQHSFCISNRVKGEWQFLFREILEIPSPYQKEQDYDFNNIAEKEWQDCIVPGSLIMQSFDIKNNAEYYYKKQITLPTSMAGNRIFIRFEGVYSNARIWINNNYITTHTGGFTPFDIEITRFFGSSITLIVGVSDIESGNLGTWNRDGIPISDASWASFYAHCNIGGILRDVTVYSLPQSFIFSNEINTILTDNYTKATLTANMIIASPNEDISIKVTLIDAQNTLISNSTYGLDSSYKISSSYYDNKYDIMDDKDFIKNNKNAYLKDVKYALKYVKFNKCKINADLYSCAISMNLDNIICWTAETPHLYTLNISIVQGENLLQTLSTKVGLRQIEYGGANNKDKNKVYVNGKSIKLRGVCRHDISHLYGRSITKSDAYAEILSYKNNNINHLRTSHYPANKYLIEACDELGIYVELENAVCFKGANGNEMLCAPQQIMQNLSEMISYYRNHCSIIIWSYANESSYKKSIAFKLSYRYIKEKDMTRPVIFSYPFTVNDNSLPYDIYSKHYANVVSEELGRKDMPVLHDEFAHVACYNVKDLERDNNCRLAWGKSIEKGWENIMKTDGALGCAIWSGIDDVVFIPKNTSSSHQRHTSGSAIGYGEWGAILDVFKREKPEAYLTKKAFSPIRISVLSASSEKLSLELNNWFDHLDLNCIKVVIKNREGVSLIDSLIDKSIPARNLGIIEFSIQNNSETYYDVIFYYGEYEIEREIIEKQTDILQNNAHSGIKSITKESTIIKVNFIDYTVSADTNKATLSIYYKEELLATGIGLLLNSAESKILSSKMDIIELTENRLKLTITERLNLISSIKYFVTVDDDGISITANQNLAMQSRIQCGIRSAIKLRTRLFSQSNIGNSFKLHKSIESVEWQKSCDFTSYPNGHIERKQGKALLCNPDSNHYGKLPPNNWKDDNYNYFLMDGNDSETLAVTNDFKTTRSNIARYSINFKDSSALTVIAEQDCEINCLTETAKNKNIILCSDRLIRRCGRWHFKHKNTANVCLTSKTKNSSISLDFIGDGIKIFGSRSKKQGDIEIFIDNVLRKVVSTRSDIGDTLSHSILDSISGLKYTNHRLTIKIKDKLGAKINCFEIINSAKTTFQSQLLLSSGRYYPGLGWGNYCGKLSNKNKQLRYKIKL